MLYEETMSRLKTVLVLLTVFKTFTCKCEKFLPEDKKLEEKKFIKLMLDIYANFSIVIHTENSTFQNSTALLTLIQEDFYRQTVLFNYDTLKHCSFNLDRSEQLLHIILLNDLEKYDKFLQNIEYITSFDVALFMIENYTWIEKKFWIQPILKKAGNIVVLIIENDKTWLYTVCYYCGNLNGTLKHIRTKTNYYSIDVDPWELKPRNFSNFNNHHFKIAYLNNFPHMYCQNMTQDQNETICTNAIGIEMEILKILSERLNFSYTLIEYKHILKKLERHLSDISNNASFDFLMGGASITASRAAKMSFTSQVSIESYKFLYIPKKARGSEFFDNLKPFKIEVWVIIFMLMVWYSIAFYWSTKIHGLTSQFSLLKCFGICFKPIIEQVQKVKLNSVNTLFSSHAILIVWWFASLIIATAYKSKLWAISIQNYNVEPSNLKQLLDSSYKIVVNTDNVEITEDILNNGDPLTIEAQKNVVYTSSICTSLQYIIENKGAILSEYGILQYHALFICSNVLEPKIYSKLRFTSASVHYTTHAWPLQRGAAYRNRFNVLISEIQKSGLTAKWKSDCLMQLNRTYNHIPLSKSTTSYPDVEDKYFLKSFVSAFSIYILGNLIALSCFVLEIVYYKKCLHFY